MNYFKLLVVALFSQTNANCQVSQEASSCDGKYTWRIEPRYIYKKEGVDWIRVIGQLNNGIVITNDPYLFGINGDGKVYYKPADNVNNDWTYVPNVLLTNIYYDCNTGKLTGIDTESYLVSWNVKVLIDY